MIKSKWVIRFLIVTLVASISICFLHIKKCIDIASPIAQYCVFIHLTHIPTPLTTPQSYRFMHTSIEEKATSHGHNKSIQTNSLVVMLNQFWNLHKSFVTRSPIYQFANVYYYWIRFYDRR